MVCSSVLLTPVASLTFGAAQASAGEREALLLTEEEG